MMKNTRSICVIYVGNHCPDQLSNLVEKRQRTVSTNILLSLMLWFSLKYSIYILLRNCVPVLQSDQSCYRLYICTKWIQLIFIWYMCWCIRFHHANYVSCDIWHYSFAEPSSPFLFPLLFLTGLDLIL